MLCESWVAVRENQGPPLNTSSFWERVHQEFCIRRGDVIRPKHALHSRFQMIHIECMRFEAVLNNVDNDNGELNEDDIIQVGLLQYFNFYEYDFGHFEAWEIIFNF
ncbi:hypothetical protein Hanom_Chr06g00483441 [Helianthus anomalus]